jgi:hypothetical protein
MNSNAGRSGRNLQLDEHGRQIEAVFATMEQLLTPPAEEIPPARRIGFGEEGDS